MFAYLIRIFLCFFPLFICAQEKTVIRVGHFPNITHAQAVIGHALTREHKGWFEKRLGPDVEVQWYVYNDGPSAMEAIFADSIDMAYAGPSPTINAYIKSEGKDIRIVCGACSGGAALVVQPNAIKSIADFKGKKIATPQIGGTQDIAARMWLKNNGFQVTLFGGDVKVLPMENADQFALFKQKDLDGAWTVEPWVSKLLLEANGEIYLQESSLWPDTRGKYVTAHLVSSVKFLTKQPALLKKWIAAQIEITDWILDHTEEAKALYNAEFKRETMHSLAQPLLDSAWKQVDFTYDPIQASLFKYADWAFQLGFLKKKPQLDSIYDLKMLDEILKEKAKGPSGT